MISLDFLKFSYNEIFECYEVRNSSKSRKIWKFWIIGMTLLKMFQYLKYI